MVNGGLCGENTPCISNDVFLIALFAIILVSFLFFINLSAVQTINRLIKLAQLLTVHLLIEDKLEFQVIECIIRRQMLLGVWVVCNWGKQYAQR